MQSTAWLGFLITHLFFVQAFSLQGKLEACSNFLSSERIDQLLSAPAGQGIVVDRNVVSQTENGKDLVVYTIRQDTALRGTEDVNVLILGGLHARKCLFMNLLSYVAVNFSPVSLQLIFLETMSFHYLFNCRALLVLVIKCLKVVTYCVFVMKNHFSSVPCKNAAT